MDNYQCVDHSLLYLKFFKHCELDEWCVTFINATHKAQQQMIIESDDTYVPEKDKHD